jgi:hypothetical protein
VWFALLILFGASLGSAYLLLGPRQYHAQSCDRSNHDRGAGHFPDGPESCDCIDPGGRGRLLWLILMFALTYNDYLSRSC